MRAAVRIIAIVICLLPAGRAGAACTVSATGVDFGVYDAFLATPLDSTGSVTVTCDQNPPYNIFVAIGPSGTSGGFAPRRMSNPGAPAGLNYNLFTDPSRSVVWGDGTSGTRTVVLNKINRNRPKSATIYGRIPPGQNVAYGRYADSLTVTITP